MPPDGRSRGALVAQFHHGDDPGGPGDLPPVVHSTFGLVKPGDDWIRQQSFYQMIMIMLPEGNVNYRIDQIPQLARDGLKYGSPRCRSRVGSAAGTTTAIRITSRTRGWGTWDDLERALRDCHAQGVKVYFFVNIHVNNLDTRLVSARTQALQL